MRNIRDLQGIRDIRKHFSGGGGAPTPTFNGLLDLYPNAATAYSLRLLRHDYSGYAIRVRRDTDNAEMDIGFLNNVLDHSSLLYHVTDGGLNPTANGYVTTWYDQSGWTRNATNGIASRQPLILRAGTILTSGGKPTIQGSNSSLATLIFSANVVRSYFITTERIGNGTGGGGYSNHVIQNDAPKYMQLYTPNGSGNLNFYNGANYASTTSFDNGIQLLEAIQGSSSGAIYKNGVADAVSIGGGSGTTSGTFNIFSFNLGGALNGYLSEVIFYETNETGNRGGIESNINSFYTIY